jgi:hypothetical protein
MAAWQWIYDKYMIRIEIYGNLPHILYDNFTCSIFGNLPHIREQKANDKEHET